MAYKVKLELMNVQLNKMQNVNNVVNSYILDNKICQIIFNPWDILNF